MDSLELMRTRRSTRKFKPDMVSSELIEKIVEAGRYAPSGGNSQTTCFIVVTDMEVRELLRKKNLEIFAAMEETPGMYRSKANAIRQAKTGKWNYDYLAPVLIITANQKDYGNNMADCACALENMMLAANELDLGSCWINQLKWLNEDPQILEIMYSLGMQESERVYGAVAIGYADTEDGMPIRKPLTRTGNRVIYI